MLTAPGVTPVLAPTPGPFDAASARKHFPILAERVEGRPLVWLDNAATTQKPNEVIDLVALTHVSNALGTVNPVREMVAMARRHGATVLVDGAQAVSHMPVNVQDLGPDFYVFSGHKVFGLTGIGVLDGRSDLLDSMPPWQGGGNMIADVTFERTVYHPAPTRFEAGTGNLADAVGLGAALEYVLRLGMENIQRHEQELLAYGTEALTAIPGFVTKAKVIAGMRSVTLEG